MIRWFDNLADFRRYTLALRPMQRAIEPYLAGLDRFEGYCCVTHRIETLLLPEQGEWKNLRESFVCACGLNGRMRTMFEAFAGAVENARLTPRALVFERTTPFYRVLAERFAYVRGCEYVSPEAAPGSTYELNGLPIVHEDMLALSVADASLDLLCHADVLEHVPDHRRALAECARVLVPGGRLLFTCPFYELETHIVRAVVKDGALVHLLPPGYHGNPLSATGSLVFAQFGWPLFSEIRAAGFGQVRIGILYDPFQGVVSTNSPYPDGFMWPVVFEAIR